MYITNTEQMQATIQQLQSENERLKKYNEGYKLLTKYKIQEWVFEAVAMMFIACFIVLLTVGLIVGKDIIWQISLCNLGAGLSVAFLRVFNDIRKGKDTIYLE